MGKKNFVEDYDPLRAHLTRDKERASAATLAAAPATRVHAPEPEPPLELPRRESGGGGGPERQPASALPARVGTVAQPKKATSPVAREEASAFVEVSPRVKCSQAAFQDLEDMLSNLHRATGSQVHYSIATRALWALLVTAEAQVLEELKKANLGRLPSTREKLAYAEYEDRVKQAFAQAFRKLPRSIFSSIMTQDREPERELAAEG